MVSEWEAAVTEFTKLTAHLHYGTSCWGRASHRATLHGKPWRIVVISLIDTFYWLLNQEEAGGLRICGPGIFHRVSLDEAHRSRTSMTPIGKFRKANGKLVKMDSHNYNMHMASCILSLDPQHRWMSMATPLVNGIEDWHWIPRCLECSSSLVLQLPQETIDYTLNIDNDWVADGRNVSIPQPGAGFTPVADPYKKGLKVRSPVHCTIVAWDAYILPLIGELVKLGRATQISGIVFRQHRSEETIRMQAVAVLCTLMVQRPMLSYILFKIPKPIINIPPMHVTTKLVTFAKSSGAGQF